ncbi:TIR domain-containing protein [Endothiovibrio diazotrophicus]
MAAKPKIFVASSVEGLDVAYAVQENLESMAEITVWPQGVFDLSEYTLDELVRQLEVYDFAVFVFSLDDIGTIRGEKEKMVRDNVLFELGMFIGQLGRSRCFILMPNSKEAFHMPSDLIGIKPGLYDENRSDDNLLAALGPSCNKIKRSIQQYGSKKRKEDESVRPSPRTPDNELLSNLVNSALQTVCRAVSVPETPESAHLRVFIFKKIGEQLVCSHYWSPNPVKELVGRLKFSITKDLAEKVAVVRAVVNEEITRTEVSPLPEHIEKDSGDVSDELNFVLASPIFNQDGSIWGTVDFDASSENGKQLLNTEVSDAAMYQLSQHLKHIFSLHGQESLNKKSQPTPVVGS